MPVGWYIRVGDARNLTHGSLIDFPLPVAAQDYVWSRWGEVGGWHLLKPVAALEGDHVCTLGTKLVINGHQIAPLIDLDSEGNPVPIWRDCRTLRSGEVYVCSTRIPRSFDSRVYGPVNMPTITGVYCPLWVDDDQQAVVGEGTESPVQHAPKIKESTVAPFYLSVFQELRVPHISPSAADCAADSPNPLPKRQKECRRWFRSAS